MFFPSDEQGRLARYESMRKGPNRRPNKHKKLFMIHADLQKQCDKQVKMFEKVNKVATADVRRQQILMEHRRDKLVKQQRRVQLQREQTHTMIEGFRSQHIRRELTWSQMPTVNQRHSADLRDSEIIRALGRLALNNMKRNVLPNLPMRRYLVSQSMQHYWKLPFVLYLGL